MSPWQLMALPFLECLVLVGIHSYLGIHVIKRKVIFVDLALAQIAALGTIVAFLFGLHPHTAGAYVFSLLFTFIGAAVFSLTRLRQTKIPQEAVIGLVYALAAAVSILIIDRAPHGAEHIKEILTGTILWVKWQSVAVAALVYLGVGVFHYIFRDKFLLISNNSEQAYRQGVSVRLWDFLFYISFGLVITVSVNTAGVLLVFVFLVVPAIMAIMITDNLFHKLLIGWGAGTVVSFLGLFASYTYDFPTGPMVVAVYGAALVLVVFALFIIKAKNRFKAAAIIISGFLVTLFVAFMFVLLGSLLAPEHEHHNGGHKQSDADSEPQSADSMLHSSILKQIEDLDIVEKREWLNNNNDVAALQKAFWASDDSETALVLSERVFDLDKVKGAKLLVKVLSESDVPLFKSEAFDLLKTFGCGGYEYNPFDVDDSEKNRVSVKKIGQCVDRKQVDSK
jgi:zinc/manganese transport system permease protein